VTTALERRTELSEKTEDLTDAEVMANCRDIARWERESGAGATLLATPEMMALRRHIQADIEAEEADVPWSVGATDFRAAGVIPRVLVAAVRAGELTMDDLMAVLLASMAARSAAGSGPCRCPKCRAARAARSGHFAAAGRMVQ
jgi:hypothetical protein